MKINMKNIGLQLCTCIWIETLTEIGISMYFLLMQNYALSALTALIFAPLIVFHYVVSRKSDDMGTSCNAKGCYVSRRSLHLTRV